MNERCDRCGGEMRMFGSKTVPGGSGIDTSYVCVSCGKNTYRRVETGIYQSTTTYVPGSEECLIYAGFISYRSIDDEGERDILSAISSIEGIEEPFEEAKEKFLNCKSVVMYTKGGHAYSANTVDELKQKLIIYGRWLSRQKNG